MGEKSAAAAELSGPGAQSSWPGLARAYRRDTWGRTEATVCRAGAPRADPAIQSRESLATLAGRAVVLAAILAGLATLAGCKTLRWSDASDFAPSALRFASCVSECAVAAHNELERAGLISHHHDEGDTHVAEGHWEPSAPVSESDEPISPECDPDPGRDARRVPRTLDEPSSVPGSIPGDGEVPVPEAEEAEEIDDLP